MSHAQACTNSKNRMAGEVKSSKPTGCECKLQMGEKEKGSKCKSSVKYRILVTFNNDRTVKNEKGKMNIVTTHQVLDSQPKVDNS